MEVIKLPFSVLFTLLFPKRVASLEENPTDAYSQSVKGFGYQWFEPKDIDKACMWHEMAANQGEPDSQNELGVIYSEGPEEKRDLSRAAFWTRKGAESNHPAAQVRLAKMYASGTGLEESHSMAYRWAMICSEMWDWTQDGSREARRLVPLYRSKLDKQTVYDIDREVRLWIALHP